MKERQFSIARMNGIGTTLKLCSKGWQAQADNVDPQQISCDAHLVNLSEMPNTGG